MEKTIGKPLEASVTLYVSEAARADFEKISGLPLASFFIVSSVKVEYGEGGGAAGESFPGVSVAIAHCAAPKCARCWIHDEQVGENHEHPTLCPRCAAAVSE